MRRRFLLFLTALVLLATGAVPCAAAETGQTDPVLLNYADWQQENLFHYSVSNIDYMSERNPI